MCWQVLSARIVFFLFFFIGHCSSCPDEYKENVNLQQQILARSTRLAGFDFLVVNSVPEKWNPSRVKFACFWMESGASLHPHFFLHWLPCWCPDTQWPESYHEGGDELFRGFKGGISPLESRLLSESCLWSDEFLFFFLHVGFLFKKNKKRAATCL